MALLWSNLDDPATREDVLTLANALVHACPVAIAIGPPAAARRIVDTLSDLALRHGLVPWQHWARGFEGRLLVEEGNAKAGAEMLRSALSAMEGMAFEVYMLETMGALSEGLRRLGQLGEAEVLADAAVTRSNATGELWCLPHLLQVKAAIVERDSTADRRWEADALRRDALALG